MFYLVKILGGIDSIVNRWLGFRNLVPVRQRGGDYPHKWHHQDQAYRYHR